MSPNARPLVPSFVVRGARLGVALAAVWGPLSCAGRSATPTTPTVGETFEMRLHRSAPVGHRGRLTVEAEKHMTTRISINGQAQPDARQDLQLHFRAVEEVVSLTPSGEPLESRFTVERFETLDAQGPHELAQPGQMVTIVRGTRWPDARVTVDGHVVGDPVSEALRMAVSMATGDPTDDEIFGTAQRQSIGASWPVDGELALRELRSAVGVPSTLMGRTRLDARTRVEGADCLDLSAEMEGNFGGTTAPRPGSPVITGTIHATRRWVFPVEERLHGLARASTMTMELVTVVQPAASRDHEEVRLSLVQRKTETFTPLPG